MSESNITKMAIAKATKELTKEKPFDKISVRDITDHCGLNRQTFYYHFQDKYELLNWIYYNEAFLPIMDSISFENWPERIYKLFVWMKKEQYFYSNTMKHTENYFQEYLMKIAETIIREAIEAIDEVNFLKEADRILISKFYAFGVCGTVLQWVEDGMKMPPEELAEHLRLLAIANERAAASGKFAESINRTIQNNCHYAK